MGMAEEETQYCQERAEDLRRNVPSRLGYLPGLRELQIVYIRTVTSTYP